MPPPKPPKPFTAETTRIVVACLGQPPCNRYLKRGKLGLPVTTTNEREADDFPDVGAACLALAEAALKGGAWRGGNWHVWKITAKARYEVIGP